MQHVGEDPDVLCYVPAKGKSGKAQVQAGSFHLLLAAIYIGLLEIA